MPPPCSPLQPSRRAIEAGNFSAKFDLLLRSPTQTTTEAEGRARPKEG